MPRDTLIIMLKVPQPGRVKTRLAADIGKIGAVWWYRHQCAALIRRLGRDPRWETVLAVAPDKKGLACRVWPPDLARLPQGRGDLGERITRAMSACRPGRVLLIGSDVPAIRPAHIAEGFAALGRADAVLGPSPDGGFWLIGARHDLPPYALKSVRWSSEHARTDTEQGLQSLRVAHISTLADVDRVTDLQGAN